uniref:G8 domain-containing protein n=1 Tax=Angiostrongylus cantonensis TaxID=6313 RepID=A0A0K0CU69_ANGCA
MVALILLLLLPTYAAGATALQCAMWGPFMDHNCTVDSDGSCALPPAPSGTRWNQTEVAKDDTEISLHCIDESKILIGGASLYCDSGEWSMRKLGYCEDISKIGKVVHVFDDGRVVVRYNNIYVLAGTKKQLKVTSFVAYQAVYMVNEYKGPVENDGVYEVKDDILFRDGNPLHQCHGNTLMILDDYGIDLTLPRKYPRQLFRFFPQVLDGILYVDGLAVAKKVGASTKRLEGTFTVGDGKIYRNGKVVAEAVLQATAIRS